MKAFVKTPEEEKLVQDAELELLAICGARCNMPSSIKLINFVFGCQIFDW
jgi:hypothetical protein